MTRFNMLGRLINRLRQLRYLSANTGKKDAK